MNVPANDPSAAPASGVFSPLVLLLIVTFVVLIHIFCNGAAVRTETHNSRFVAQAPSSNTATAPDKKEESSEEGTMQNASEKLDKMGEPDQAY